MTKRKSRRKPQRVRHVSVRSVRRSEPDVRRLGNALIHYALQEAAAEAAAEAEAKRRQEQAGE